MKKIIIIVVFCLFLTGCFESKEEKEKKQRYINQAKINAINYVEEKYGFKPKIRSSKALTSTASASGGINLSYYNGEVELEMIYNNKSFLVRINGDIVTANGRDNYQKDLINNSILELAKKTFGKNPEKYMIYRDEMIDKYYDGNNLASVINRYSTYFYLSYCNYDLSSYKNVDLFNEMNMKVYVYNFRNLNVLNKFYYPHDDGKSMAGDYNTYNNALILKQAIFNDNVGQKYYDLDIKKYDNFYYIATGGIVENIYECEIDGINEVVDKYYRLNYVENYVQNSKSYCVDGDFKGVYLYYPINSYKSTTFIVNFPNNTGYNGFSYFHASYVYDENNENKYKYGLVENNKFESNNSFKFVVFSEKENGA